ncbi:peptide chain release factor 1 [Flavivirga aquatica]|uniref:Peptide chain release factor 1 n=1 Tax=Flavivirga aquatica TaxID=1849968 RepID=A0A1E5TD70_9FLAO|nr:alternative ribosome rescue aminoacyl-tRNA hydrolase ArfB [Flavivirga aquatica]OEK09301.1 peptide chain release factor 1 [Flavivirga aquatica]
MIFNEELILRELKFKAISSSGSGGQHVNKVASKVELVFNLFESSVFNSEQKERLRVKLQHRLTKDFILILQCDESRSQHKNKELVIKRFLRLIKFALIIPKRRIPTKTPKSVIRRRLKNKSKLSDKKINRRKPNVD